MKAGSLCGLLHLSKATPCLRHRKTKEKQILIHGAVTTYQMPEGVEHSNSVRMAETFKLVTTYQMPEGVEHKASLGLSRPGNACDYLSDAGRR